MIWFVGPHPLSLQNPYEIIWPLYHSSSYKRERNKKKIVLWCVALCFGLIHLLNFYLCLASLPWGCLVRWPVAWGHLVNGVEIRQPRRGSCRVARTTSFSGGSAEAKCRHYESMPFRGFWSKTFLKITFTHTRKLKHLIGTHFKDTQFFVTFSLSKSTKN